MPSTLSPNMSLILPTVGQEPGPNWALDLNNSLSIIDQHNHAPGNGAPITSASLDINIDLPFNNNNAISLRSIRFQPSLAPLSTGLDIGCVYVSGQDLYYNDTLGNQIQLTAAGAVNGTPGSIGNLIAPAAVTYVPSTQTFVFESNQGNATPASLDGGNLYLRNIVPGGNYIQLQPNAVLSASYSLTLPSALPASISVLLLDTLGNISTSGTASALSVTTLNSTTVNASTANLTSSLAIKNDNGLLQFRNTADSTQFASITGSSSGLTLNLPDTADSYVFQVNGVTKLTIDNNGLVGTNLVNETNVVDTTSYTDITTVGYTPPNIFGPGFGNMLSMGTVVITQPRTLALQMVPGVVVANGYSGIRSTGNPGGSLYWRILITGPGGFSYSCRSIGGAGLNEFPSGWSSTTPIWNSATNAFRFQGTFSTVWNDGTFATYVDSAFMNGTELVILPTAGTYTLTMQAGTTNPGEVIDIRNFRFIKQIVF